MSYEVGMWRQIKVFDESFKAMVYENKSLQWAQSFECHCLKNGTEKREIEFAVPSSFHFDSKEHLKWPSIPVEEKHLTYGPSSSFVGQLFELEYFLSVKVHFKQAKQKLRVEMPVQVLTPFMKVADLRKKMVSQHPCWNPYEYGSKEFYQAVDIQL